MRQLGASGKMDVGELGAALTGAWAEQLDVAEAWQAKRCWYQAQVVWWHRGCRSEAWSKVRPGCHLRRGGGVQVLSGSITEPRSEPIAFLDF